MHVRGEDGTWASVGEMLDQEPEWCAGGHGLCAPPTDYIRFERALLRGGELDGVRILEQATVDAAFTNQVGELDVPSLVPTAAAGAADASYRQRRPHRRHSETHVIEIDLADGPGNTLVRGFATCLSSVTELPLVEVPSLADEEPILHAVGAWKSWLAGRDFGLVPIADPTSFQWAGWWIAVVDGSQSPSAHGPQRQAATLAFGTPPGIVLSPQDPALLGQATADLPISSAFAVASLDPVLRPVPAATALTGTVEQIAIAPHAEAPMQIIARARAIAGQGLDGDRYARRAGTFSPRLGQRPGYELTLIAAEVIEDLTARDAKLAFASTRRNILTRDIDVNALVSRDFRIGDVHCRGLRLAEPCVHLERLAGPGLLRPLIHRGGLRVDILTDGDISPGSLITT